MNHPPLDAELASRYVAGATSPAETMRVEQALDTSPAWRGLVGSQVAPERLDASFAGVMAELDAPKRGWVERVMVRLGMDDHVARLLAATPVMRRSWYIATAVVLFFGLIAASPGEGDGSLALFLAIAPLVPVLGVGLAYGPGIDPAHDMTVATPLSGFRLLLLRSLAVLATSVVFGGLSAVLIAREHGLQVVAWMLPALALTGITLALSSVMPTRVAAGSVAGVWLMVVAIVANVADDLAVFEAPAQPVYAVLAAAAAMVVVMRREAFETAEVRS